jgi:hypothetical protein
MGSKTDGSQVEALKEQLSDYFPLHAKPNAKPWMHVMFFVRTKQTNARVNNKY